MNRKHGLIKHPLYKKWKKLIAKCKYPYQDGYEIYGAEGVTMCHEWENDFKKFYDWAIANNWTEGKIITIKQGSKVIAPETAEITTIKERQRRKSTTVQVEWEGHSYSLVELCEKLGKNYFTVCSRINMLKWSLHDALMTESRKVGKGAGKYGKCSEKLIKATDQYSKIFDKEASAERSAQQKQFGELWGCTIDWFSSRFFVCNLASKIQLYVTANSKSEILRTSGLDRFIIEPIICCDDSSVDKCDSSYVRMTVCCSMRAHEIVSSLTAIPPFVSSDIQVPITPKKIASGRTETSFIFPLHQILQTKDPDVSLCKVIVEIYLKYIYDFFVISELNEPIASKQYLLEKDSSAPREKGC